LTEKNLKKTVVSGIKWLTITKIIIQTFRWLSTFWVIRLLDSHDYGVMAITEILLGFLVAFHYLYIDSIIIRYKVISKPVLSTLKTLCLIIGLTLFCIQFFSSYYFSQFYNTPEADLVLKLLAITYIIESFNVLPQAKLAKEMVFKKLAKIDLISSTIMPIVVLTSAHYDMGYWSIAFGHLSYAVTRFIALNLIAPTQVPFKLHFKRIFPLMRFGLQNTSSALVAQINSSLDTIVGGFFIPTAQLGIYQVGLQVSLIPLKKITPELRRIAFPAYSKINNQLNKVAEYFIKSTRIICILVFPIFWGLGLIAEELIEVVLTNKWLESVLIIQVLCIALPFKLLDEISCSMLNAIGRADIILTNSLLTSLIFIIAIFMFINIGITGLAYAWLASILIPFIVLMVRIVYVLPLTIIDILRAIAPSVMAGILMSIMIYLLKLTVNTTHLGILIYSMLIGALTYASYCFFIHKEILKEIRNLFKL